MSKVASPVGRSVTEWIGATPDAKIPPRVLLRIFDRAGGHCHITGRMIAPGEKWQAEHVIALADGGQHRESNLAPALVGAHKEKTAAEAASRARVRARRKSHIGARVEPVRRIPQPPPTISERTAKNRAREAKPSLPPRPLFRDNHR